MESELELIELDLRKLELESGGSNRGRSVEVDSRGGQLPEYIESEAEHFFFTVRKDSGNEKLGSSRLFSAVKIYGQG